LPLPVGARTCVREQHLCKRRGSPWLTAALHPSLYWNSVLNSAVAIGTPASGPITLDPESK